MTQNESSSGIPAFAGPGQHGMTLPDYFAAAAMQDFCAAGPASDWSSKRERISRI